MAKTKAKPIATDDVLATFFDILGWKSLVREKDAEWLYRVLTKLRNYTAPQDEMDRKHFGSDAIAFSDCIMHRVKLDSPAVNAGANGTLFYALQALGWVQSAIAYEDEVLLRGAVVIGDLYLDDGIVFGGALLDAYKLETDVACYPRILVDCSVEEALSLDYGRLGNAKRGFEEESKLVSALTWVDYDGRRFVDYLGQFMPGAESIASWEQRFVQHRKLISRLAEEVRSKGDLLAKYHWAASYHNACVAEFETATGGDAADLLLDHDAVPRFDAWDKAPPKRRVITRTLSSVRSDCGGK